MNDKLLKFLAEYGEESNSTPVICVEDQYWKQKAELAERLHRELAAQLEALGDISAKNSVARNFFARLKDFRDIVVKKGQLWNNGDNNIVELDQVFTDDALILLYKDLLVDEYIPPIQLRGIGAHLLALDLFYNVFAHITKEVSLSALLRLDRSLLILTERVTNLTSSDGVSDLLRNFKSKEK